jgi:hypothetical protein
MRQPWINPVRRRHVLAAAVVGALLFGGGGVLLGHAIADNHDERSTLVPFERGRGHAPGLGQFPGRGPLKNGPGQPPGRATPTPQPSPTKTS